MNKTMRIGIVIATYQRKDGMTPSYLRRALESIKAQTHTDYKVFLIGDKYDDEEEFTLLANSIIPEDKIYYENLKIAKEREKYSGDTEDDRLKLWCSGGVNARNEGIDRSLSQGFSHICHMDHDDMWDASHLEIISRKAEEGYFFIATKSLYLEKFYLPPWVAEDIESFIPEGGKIVHSAHCMDYSNCDIRYVDVFEKEGHVCAADLFHFDRVGKYIRDNNLKSCLVSVVTCFHDMEHNPLSSLKSFE